MLESPSFFSKNSSLHTLFLPNEEFLVSNFHLSGFQYGSFFNQQEKPKETKEIKDPNSGKSSFYKKKDKETLKKQLEFLKEAYKPRSQDGKEKMQMIFESRIQQNSNKRKKYRLERKKTPFLSTQIPQNIEKRQEDNEKSEEHLRKSSVKSKNSNAFEEEKAADLQENVEINPEKLKEISKNNEISQQNIVKKLDFQEDTTPNGEENKEISDKTSSNMLNMPSNNFESSQNHDESLLVFKKNYEEKQSSIPSSNENFVSNPDFFLEKLKDNLAEVSKDQIISQETNKNIDETAKNKDQLMKNDEEIANNDDIVKDKINADNNINNENFNSIEPKNRKIHVETPKVTLTLVESPKISPKQVKLSEENNKKPEEFGLNSQFSLKEGPQTPEKKPLKLLQTFEKSSMSEATPNFLKITDSPPFMKKTCPEILTSPRSYNKNILESRQVSQFNFRSSEEIEKNGNFLELNANVLHIPLNLYEDKALDHQATGHFPEGKTNENNYKIKITSETIPSYNTLNLNFESQTLHIKGNNNDNLMNFPDIPSKYSLIKLLTPTHESIPSIMINNEAINQSKQENLSNISIDSNFDSKENDKTVTAKSTTPKSLQNIENLNEPPEKNGRKSFSNKQINKNPREKQKNSEKLIDIHKKEPIKKHNSVKKRSTLLSLNKSSIIPKSSGLNNERNNSVFKQQMLQSKKEVTEEAILNSKNSETKLFPAELSIDFSQKYKIYKKPSLFTSNANKTLHHPNNSPSCTVSKAVPGKSSAEINKFYQAKCKLTFYSFNEKVKRFFEKNYQALYLNTEKPALSTSLPKISLKKESPLAKDSKEFTLNIFKELRPPGANEKEEKMGPPSRFSHRFETNLSPKLEYSGSEKRENANNLFFSKSYKINNRISYSQTPKNSESFKEENTFEQSFLLKEKLLAEGHDYEVIVQKIQLKMKEHDEILSNNYIYFNQKNIKTLINEEFFLYLDIMISSNYFFYHSFPSNESFFRQKIQSLSGFQPFLLRRTRTKSSSFFHHKSTILKYYSSQMNEIMNFPNRVYSLDTEEETIKSLNDFFKNSDFKQLKMVIDEEIDESFIEDQFSPLFDKLPSTFDQEIRKKNSLNLLDSRKIFKSKFLSASTPTNNSEEKEEFLRDEEEYSLENTDIFRVRGKDRIFLEYFRDIQKKVIYFRVHVKENIMCFISKLDKKLQNCTFLKQKMEIDAGNLAKLGEENEKSNNFFDLFLFFWVCSL